ncbi:MAG: hypothetical protein ACE5JP_04510 [Candidatus Bipolaricaulia bacterium]
MKVSEVLRAFEKLGMRIREGRDTLAFFRCGERLVLWTKVPHGRGELKGRLPHYIRQQLRLNEEQFGKLIQCEIRRPEYVQILKDKKVKISISSP